MNDFLSLVKERPDPSLKIYEYHCPYCESKNVQHKNNGMTLVGGREEDDVNHVWTIVTCMDCGKISSHEHRFNNTWYTDDDGSRKTNKILKGIPSCFESYTYTCAHCGGNVNRHRLDSNGEPCKNGLITTVDADGKWKKQYSTVFRCQKCNTEVFSDTECWVREQDNTGEIKNSGDIKRIENGWAISEDDGKYLIKDFYVKEDIGKVVINTVGLDKIKFTTG